MSRPLTLAGVLLVMACFAANRVATRHPVSRGRLDPVAVPVATPQNSGPSGLPLAAE